MSIDPNAIKSLSNDPTYQAALNNIKQFEAGAPNVYDVLNSASSVYGNPNVPQSAQEALHQLVQNVFKDAAANNPKWSATQYEFADNAAFDAAFPHTNPISPKPPING